MNERLFELIQSHNGLCGLLWTEEDKQEFAELIVRECASFVNEFATNGDVRTGNDLLEHFGVEE
jgi:hypothetical protein